MNVLRRLHLLVGIVGIVTFIGTGQYMDRWLDHLYGQPDGVRMLFRSAHIYLLLSSLINTMLGLYLTQRVAAWRRWLQSAGSLAFLAGPPMFLVAFFQEPWLSGLERPWARPALFLALGGTIAHLLAAAFAGWHAPRVDGPPVQRSSDLAANPVAH